MTPTPDQLGVIPGESVRLSEAAAFNLIGPEANKREVFWIAEAVHGVLTLISKLNPGRKIVIGHAENVLEERVD